MDHEGFPTSEINYLQRLRILVEKEQRIQELEAKIEELEPRTAPESTAGFLEIKA